MATLNKKDINIENITINELGKTMMTAFQQDQQIRLSLSKHEMKSIVARDGEHPLFIILKSAFQRCLEQQGLALPKNASISLTSHGMPPTTAVFSIVPVMRIITPALQ